MMVCRTVRALAWCVAGGVAAAGLSREAAAQDYALVASGNNDAVIRYEFPSGQAEGVFATGILSPLNSPYAMVVGPDGLLYISVYNNDLVTRYNIETGEHAGIFVTANSGGLAGPRDILFMPDGTLLVCSSLTSEILRYSTEGAPMGRFDSGASGISNPQAMAFGPDGRLYVASYNNDRILRFNGTTGAFNDVFVAEGAGGLNGPFDLAFRANRWLYVSSQITNEVLRYDAATGAFDSAFVTFESGGLSSPRVLGWDKAGDLYVSGFSGVNRYDGETGKFAAVFAQTGLDAPFGFVFLNEPPPPPGCEADFDGNGLVNAADVGAYLTAYFGSIGPCP